MKCSKVHFKLINSSGTRKGLDKGRKNTSWFVKVYHVGHPLRKIPVNCRKLWTKCLEIAGTKFVNLCDGISGKIGSLVEGEDFKNEPIDISIDTFVVDLTREGSECEVGGL